MPKPNKKAFEKAFASIIRQIPIFKPQTYFLLLIVALASFRASAAKGCYQNEEQRIYTQYAGIVFRGANQTAYPSYTNPNYPIYPGNCPGADLLVQEPGGICYVGQNRGSLWTYDYITDCNLDEGTWIMVISCGIIALVLLRKRNA